MTDLELAERAAREAGEVLLGWFGREPEGLASKTSVTDPVSEADLEAAALADEAVVRALDGKSIRKVIVRAPKLVNIVADA